MLLHILKTVLGGILVLVGLIALITPFTPGSWLVILGAELLGFRLIFARQFQKWRFTEGSGVLGSRAVFWGTVLVGALPFLLLAIWAARSRVPQPSPPTSSQISTLTTGHLRIGSQVLTVELARTPAEHARGLSGRDALAEDHGMLFLFSERAERSFWMKDTRIPLDLLWIQDGILIGITHSVQPEPGVPEERLRHYASPGPVDWVLETNGGWSATYGIRMGDRIELREEGGDVE